MVRGTSANASVRLGMVHEMVYPPRRCNPVPVLSGTPVSEIRGTCSGKVVSLSCGVFRAGSPSSVDFDTTKRQRRGRCLSVAETMVVVVGRRGSNFHGHISIAASKRAATRLSRADGFAILTVRTVAPVP